MAGSKLRLLSLVVLLAARGAGAAPEPTPLPPDPPEGEATPTPGQAEPPPGDGSAPDPKEAAAPEPTEAKPGEIIEDDDTGSGLGNVGKVDEGGRGLGHRKQFGLSAIVGSGFRGIFPYDKQPCTDDISVETCTGRSPATIDLGLSYGLSDGFELLVEARFGLEAEKFIDQNQIAFMPGFRVYFDPKGGFKFFVAGQIVIDNTDWSDAMVKNPDVGGRIALGAQLDFVRQFGLYLQGGAQFGVRRWFSFQVDAGLGVQVRFP